MLWHLSILADSFHLFKTVFHTKEKKHHILNLYSQGKSCYVFSASVPSPFTLSLLHKSHVFDLPVQAIWMDDGHCQGGKTSSAFLGSSPESPRQTSPPGRQLGCQAQCDLWPHHELIWNLTGLGILCLQIAWGGSGSRERVPDHSLAGTRA